MTVAPSNQLHRLARISRQCRRLAALVQRASDGPEPAGGVVQQVVAAGAEPALPGRDEPCRFGMRLSTEPATASSLTIRMSDTTPTDLSLVVERRVGSGGSVRSGGSGAGLEQRSVCVVGLVLIPTRSWDVQHEPGRPGGLQQLRFSVYQRTRSGGNRQLI